MLTSNLFLLSLAVLIVLLCVVLGTVVHFAARSAQDKPAAERKIVRLRTDSLRNAFRGAVELVESNIASRSERYNIPWIMVLNEGDDPRPLPIAQSGIASVLGAEATGAAAAQGISWHFFDRAVVIDITAAYLGSPDDDAAEKPWDEFLGLCRAYRPQRPFDSVVVTVPAATLLASDADARLELERHARLAHRRLWLAQNRFAMRFAVYVVVTGCEVLDGFAAFARALPETIRASMLGWSSPFDLSTTYQAGWIDTAMDTVTRAVSDSVAELFTLDTGHLDARAFLLLPARIDAIRAQLQLYVDELMRPSAYHEPFFFRGIYLTGDSSEFARSGRASPTPSAGDAQVAEREPFFGEPAKTFEVLAETAVERSLAAEHGEFDDGNPPENGESSQQLVDLMRQPAFLRDLFERKIFVEYGLTRPSRSQQLARPVLHRALRWGGVAVLGGWSVGLAVATVSLYHRGNALVGALDTLHEDEQERTLAEQSGETLTPDWYRSKALALIAMNDSLPDNGFSSVFMPGSWRFADDLGTRVHERFEQTFGEIVVTALEREMLAHVSELTGVVRDSGTGQLIVGEDCTAPAAGSSAEARSLAVDDLPAMAALRRFVQAADQLDTALQAMQRLQRHAPGAENALRLAVRYAFGVDLQGSVSGSLPYFYRDAAHGGVYAEHGGVYAADGADGLELPVVREVLRCTFDKGAQQLDAQMFAQNPLFTIAHAVDTQIDSLNAADEGAVDFTQQNQRYATIVSGIDAERDLLAGGKSGWMRQPSFAPGPVYDGTMAAAARNTLIGPVAVRQARSRSADAFRSFRDSFGQQVGASDSGLVWNENDARFELSPARVALRDGLANLLSQPFMVPPRTLAFPSLPEGSIVTWDDAQLDQALALADVRKRFLASGLNGLPGTVAASVEAALDARFAQLMIDQTVSAATIAQADGGETDSAAFAAARTRLDQIGSALSGMGATAQASDLAAFVSADALAHLQLVDAALTGSELYSMRPAGLSSSARAPVLAAFGIADAAGLDAYLDQQAARVLELGKEASVYLSALDTNTAAFPLAGRWREIDQDLARYQLKNPNSNLLMLEQFVRASAANPGALDCLGTFPARPVFAQSDYFGVVLDRLYDSLRARCSESDLDALRARWQSFASLFNQGVAGRAPFDGLERTVNYGGDAEVAGSADFGELGQVLESYGRVSRAFRPERGSGYAAGVGESVQTFIASFDPVAAFLAPLYPAAGGAPGGYDMDVQFRTDRRDEVDADQVMDWTLDVGDQSASQDGAPHTLHWNYGTTVSLVLRLAKNSPIVARGDPQQREYTTDGRTLTWRFADPWALISFISRHRIADPDIPLGGRSQLLAFEFPVGQAGEAASARPPLYARVFVRITVMPAGSKIPLRWPPRFPSHAPDWSAL
ncbi:type VI secretion protein IcmF [Burkholderia sp. WAC0059]|uniref:type VI secretion system protein n=1 Tax=Burkholderia sp. WAC0059 TaxID=2066022 RepID=UPI000C7EE6D7|nr:type VI secretion system protein [Burkholderia sp. WAC0059]PLZ00093.1 type VI secretion protein IcmF [Burkholderia sp. WAC0059]